MSHTSIWLPLSTIQQLPSAVLFDLDGTLVDTADDLGAALNHVLTLHGVANTTAEQYRPMASHGAKGLLQLGFGESLQDFDYALLRQQLLAYYEQHLTVHSCLFPGANALLALLDSAKIPWGIITNKPYKLAAQMVRQLPELHGCQVLLGGDSLAQKKPDPTPLFVASHLLGVTRNQCWYVGDAERDIQAGNRAMMQTFIAGFGFIDQSDQVEQWHADFMLDSFADLSAVVSRLIR